MAPPDDQLMPIGRFARLTGLSRKALRHYDDQGLLAPAAIDEATGYRLYAPAQTARARAIRTLRAVELPLAEVRDLLDEHDPAVLHQRLAEHRRRLAMRRPSCRSFFTGWSR